MSTEGAEELGGEQSIPSEPAQSREERDPLSPIAASAEQSALEQSSQILPKNPQTLNAKQRRKLRSLAHNLRPVLQLGKGGVSDGFVTALVEAVERHELLKISLLSEAPVDRKEAAEELAALSGAHLIQLVGRSVVIFRRNPRAPRISLSGLPPSKEENGRGGARSSKRAERTGRDKKSAGTSARKSKTPATSRSGKAGGRSS